MKVFYFDRPAAIFVRIPKTGTTSILRGIFGGTEQSSLVSAEFPNFDWPDVFSFSFVRNPFDRFVSAFEMFRKYRRISEPSDIRFRNYLTMRKLLEFARAPKDESASRFLQKVHQHVAPISSFPIQTDQLHQLFRFEDFEFSFQKLSSILSLNSKEVPHFRKTGRTEYRHYYGAEEARLARKLFSQDCDAFGYCF